nr:unnamed protein product [Callosobruchus chinensis]
MRSRYSHLFVHIHALGGRPYVIHCSVRVCFFIVKNRYCVLVRPEVSIATGYLDGFVSQFGCIFVLPLKLILFCFQV